MRVISPRKPAHSLPPEPDGLEAFALEAESAAPPPPPQPSGSRYNSAVLLLVVAAVIAATAFAAYGLSKVVSPAAAAQGSLRVESEPAGAEVVVGGTPRGVTPLTLALPVGSHVVTLRHGTRTKDLAVTLDAGATAVHHVSWPAEAPAPAATTAAATSGSLSIVTDPPRAAITVDGVARGVSPLTLDNLAPGEHQVVVRGQGITQRRTVRVEPGLQASLVFTSAPAGALSGWMSISSRVPVQIYEGSDLLGTSESDRIMLPVGDRELRFVNDRVGYTDTRRVSISPAQVSTVQLAMPRAPVHLNAIPWAEVFIDGQRIGETPLGNVMQPLGTHEVVFRHPQLGERRTTVTVTTREVARVSVDMRTP